MWYVRNKNFTVASNMILSIQDEAERMNSYEGKVGCFQILGLINYQTKNYKKAVNFYEQGLDLMVFLPHRDPLKCQIYLYLLMAVFDNTDSEKKIQALNDFSKFLDDQQKKTVPSFAIAKAEWYNYYYHFLYYLGEEDIENAKYYLDLADKHSDNSANYNRPYFFYVKAQYYVLINDLEKALDAINKSIDLNPTRETETYFGYKGDIYSKMGLHKEAYAQYSFALDKQVGAWKELFVKEFDILKEQTELFYAQLENSELEYLAQREKNRVNYFLLLLLILILSFVIALILYNNKYERKLQTSALSLNEEKRMLEITKRNLEDVLKQAEESNIKKTAFLASMSHEIRTPLNSIIGFSELIIEEGDDLNVDKEFASIIQSNSVLLLKLVNDIVNQSRLESESISIEYADSDVMKCAHNVVSSIDKIIKPNVRINIKSNVDSFIIRTDIFRIQQILTNLLGNAAKFTQEGEITLEIIIDKNHLKFVVTDTGCGIPISNHEKVFKKFEKINEQDSGTGLGLWICSSISEKLNGKLYIDPTYVNGAKFIFEHPL